MLCTYSINGTISRCLILNFNVSECLFFRHTSGTPLPSILNEIKSTLNEEVKSTCNQDNDKLKQELNILENRLQTYIDQRFLQLKQHIDDRLNRLEEKLTNSKD
jgi:hypothetical protein